MSWRRNPVRVSAPLAARRCAIVRNGSAMHRREPFDPSRRHLVKRTTIFLPQPYSSPATRERRGCRSVGTAEFVSRRPTIAERSRPDPRLVLTLGPGHSPGLPLLSGILGNVDGKDASGSSGLPGGPKVRQNFAQDLGMSTFPIQNFRKPRE
jgi:hypothetical protein